MKLDKKLISILLILVGILGMIVGAAWDIIRGKSEIVFGPIEYAGIGLGIVLLLIGIVMFIMKPKVGGEPAPGTTEASTEAPAEEKTEETTEETKEEKKEEYECPSCGATVPGDSTVCPECGEEFEE
jgi:predicted RNA-binding Zn-ribbon protein involved in translation (DUF1610 family)